VALVQGASPGAQWGVDEDTGPGRALPLSGDEVHVWRGRLDIRPETADRIARILSPDELARAERFRFARDRERYISGRAQLRRLLGRYLDTDPSRLRFAYGPYGKPTLPESGIHFNLSHSGAVALAAVTRAGEIGIDVELANEDFARERIAEHFFSPGEVAALRALADGLQPRAFLTCWTRKEAFIKARGDGLSLALDSFDVSLAPGQPAAILRTAWSKSDPTEWSLSDLSDMHAGYIAALAVRSSTAVTVTCRELPGIDTEYPSEQEKG
jgi:4'-phosphopantetheinyl transferase